MTDSKKINILLAVTGTSLLMQGVSFIANSIVAYRARKAIKGILNPVPNTVPRIFQK